VATLDDGRSGPKNRVQVAAVVVTAETKSLGFLNQLYSNVHPGFHDDDIGDQLHCTVAIQARMVGVKTQQIRIPPASACSSQMGLSSL